MPYRGFFYFLVVSFLLYSAIFSRITIFGNTPREYSILKKIEEMSSRNPDKKPEKNNEIVETFIELDKPDQAEFISNLFSRMQGKLTEKKGYSYFNDLRSFNPVSYHAEAAEKTASRETDPFNQDREKIEALKDSEQRQQQLSKPDILPNRYQGEQVVINLDSSGLVGVNAEKKEYVKFLVDTAKKIFYNWIEFIPVMQIRQNLIKIDRSGNIEGTIGIYFDRTSRNYDVVLVSPFASDTMNELTTRSFSYITLPYENKETELTIILVRLRIYPNSMHADAEFKFEVNQKTTKEK